MKEGPTSLLKHRLTGKSVKKKKKTVCICSQAVSGLLQLQLCRCVTEQKVQYRVNTFQAISAYFVLVFTSLLFPAEGAPGLG